MKYLTNFWTSIGVLALSVNLLFLSPRVQAAEKEPSIIVRTGSSTAWTYTHRQLLAMATDALTNMKGSRKKQAIPLVSILSKDTKIAPEKIAMVVVIGEKITVLRGKDLSYLSKLVLATGPDKAAMPHEWALAPRDEETYKAISASMGSRRKKGVYRIDIVLKDDQQK